MIAQDAVTGILLSPVVRRIAAAVVALFAVALVVRLVNRVLTRAVSDSDTRYRSRKIVTFLGYAAGVLLVIAIGSGNLGAFGITVGVLGAAVVFSLQEVITSVAGWLAISFGNLYRVGDRIQLAGIRGDVIDIGIVRTTLMECGEWVAGDLYDGRIVRIANSFVFKEPVFNYSADFPFLWDEIKIPVRYGSDVRRAREIIETVTNSVVGDYTKFAREAWAEMVRKYRIEDARIDPLVTLVATDNWIEFTVRYVVDYRRRRTTKDAIFTRILEEFDRAKESVALASATFELVQVPTVEVKLLDRVTR
ncbi:MAG: mechanosensitive ion channel protein MscS [Gemmatimonadales bacterium]|nr:MAG: mechanosensitive ion channel protein MscS [Gemmatimonadales bacterium]